MITESNNNNESFENLDDEINLRPLLNSIIRAKREISILSLLSLLIGFSFVIFPKRQWSGEFEIVLKTAPNLSALSNISQRNNKIIGAELFGNDTQLNTQIAILKSPSVLLEIFEFVKTNKKGLKFEDWKRQLKFEKQKKTTVLKLSYSDTDKSLINPVLTRISKVYQQYSGKARKRNFELANEYFSSQLAVYRKKSKTSLNEVQKFADKYNLTIVNDEPSLPNSSNESDNKQLPMLNNVIEREMIKARNDIDFIENQINKIKSYDIESLDIIYLASTFIPKNEFDIMNEILSLDAKIEALTKIYKKDDIKIRELLFKKKNLMQTAKNITLNILKGMKDEAELRLRSSERPEGVFIKYRQLLENSTRDKIILQKLENDFRLLKLQEARLQDPWELITNPTTLPNPVPRNTILKSLLAGITGLILSSLYFFILDSKKGIIYSLDEIKAIINCKYYECLIKNDNSDWIEELDFFLRRTFIASPQNLAFFIVGDVSQSEKNEISNKIREAIPKEELNICKNIKETYNYSSLVLITIIGKTKRDELKDVNKKLIQLNKKIISSLSLA